MRPAFALRLLLGSLFAAMSLAFVFATPIHAEDLWRHGTLVPKGDAGFIYMAAEGGFAKAENKRAIKENDPLMGDKEGIDFNQDDV